MNDTLDELDAALNRIEELEKENAELRFAGLSLARGIDSQLKRIEELIEELWRAKA